MRSQRRLLLSFNGGLRLLARRPAVSYKSAVRVVLIAAKRLATAKTRLMPVLPAIDERVALADAMFRDVLNAALGPRSADRVAVVTCDAALIATAQAAGATSTAELY